MKLAEPIDEGSDALLYRRFRFESDHAFELRAIGTGLQYIAGLHWRELTNGRSADGLLDDANEIDQFDWVAISDVIYTPRRITCLLYTSRCV